MIDRLRVALVVDRFGRRFGGAEAYSVDLARHLLAHHDVTVVAHEFDHDLAVNEKRITGPRWWPSWLRVLHFAFCANRITANGFDIVHSNMDGVQGHVQVVHVSPVRYRRLIGKSWLKRALQWCSLRNLVYFKLEGVRMIPSLGHQVVAVAPVIKDQLHLAYGESLNVQVIPPGVEPIEFDANLRARTRLDLGLKPDDIVCLLVARNPMRKGLKTLLEAVMQLPSNFQVLVVGVDRESRLEIDSNGSALIGRLQCVAPTANLSAYYFAADICVHPTLGDSFAMVPLEAMAHRLPVILSSAQYCGFAQYLAHERDAFILNNPTDAQELKSAILSVAPGTELRGPLIENSQKVVHELCWSNVCARHEHLYGLSLEARLDPTT